MGDTLSGMIGGLLAQGYDPFDAASIGVYLHSQSAQMLSRLRGPLGFGASELAHNLPSVWRQLLG
ncbi:MAG TPA: bifunctional ADP-dependent NAD(P)H-hydrate dehydratase/NAD(P)H-hydrate epimerase, partial [Dissulfuribacter thermophilus]|nr:bifunctional ADP-dependent NAD(P)H-hydrate dehydratase/NAD(P)H-hydrate epimerase [Dissulfuribacter thermophilus]